MTYDGDGREGKEDRLKSKVDLKTTKSYAKELFCVLILTSINSKHTTNIPVFLFFGLFIFGHATWLVGSWFPDQELNLDPQQ